MVGSVFKFIGSLFAEDEESIRKREESAEFKRGLRKHNSNSNREIVFAIIGGVLFVLGGIGLKLISWIFHFDVGVWPALPSIVGAALLGLSFVYENRCDKSCEYCRYNAKVRNRKSGIV